MKKLTLFAPLFMMFALSIALPKRGFPAELPKIEKATLQRDFGTDQRYTYLFDFDFVNALQQPIEIISVDVFDVNGRRVEQDWAISGRNWDPRILTHALSGSHPLVEIFSKPRGTPLEQATVSPVGDRIEITVTNRILSAGHGIRPSMYILASKNKYDSLILRVAYRVNGNLQEVSRTFAECPPELVTLGTCVPVSEIPEDKAPNLIVLVHGCCTDANDVRNVWDILGRQIAGTIPSPGAWEIVVWDWSDYTPKHDYSIGHCPQCILTDADAALQAAEYQGNVLLANAIANHHYKHVHLIGHSSGAKLIDVAAKTLVPIYKQYNEDTFIHLTFLDAYTPNDTDITDYGSLPHGYSNHYSENYVDRTFTHPIYDWISKTNELLPNALNFDITDWQPDNSKEKENKEKDGGHQWPRYWYEKSVTSSGFRCGFALSVEGGNNQINRLPKQNSTEEPARKLINVDCESGDVPPPPSPTPVPTPSP
ncbi:MAG: hypothetical protein ACRESZ_11410 [Methylococcales bacterium]